MSDEKWDGWTDEDTKACFPKPGPDWPDPVRIGPPDGYGRKYLLALGCHLEGVATDLRERGEAHSALILTNAAAVVRNMAAGKIIKWNL